MLALKMVTGNKTVFSMTEKVVSPNLCIFQNMLSG